MRIYLSAVFSWESLLQDHLDNCAKAAGFPGSLAGDCTLHIGETPAQLSWGSGRLACSQDVNPPQSPLCSEALPFVCHLFTLLAQAIVMSTMRSRSTASWIGSGFFIPALRTLVTLERQWLRAWRAIASSKAQRHSTYPIKRVQHSAPWCCMPSEKAAWEYHLTDCGFGFQ